MKRKIMTLLIIQSSPVSRHFLPLRTKYSQHPVLRHTSIYKGVSKTFRTGRLEG